MFDVWYVTSDVLNTMNSYRNTKVWFCVNGKVHKGILNNLRFYSDYDGIGVYEPRQVSHWMIRNSVIRPNAPRCNNRNLMQEIQVEKMEEHISFIKEQLDIAERMCKSNQEIISHLDLEVIPSLHDTIKKKDAKIERLEIELEKLKEYKFMYESCTK